MSQELLNNTFTKLLEVDQCTICIKADSTGFSVYESTTDSYGSFSYSQEIDYELVDVVLHNSERILWQGLKETIKALFKNKVITDIREIAPLRDIDIYQHMVDENNVFSTTSLEEKDKLKEVVHGINLREKIITDEQRKIIELIESPLIITLASMEMEWISVDKKYLEDMWEDIEMKLIKVWGKLSVTLGTTALNLNSPKQLADLFFNKMKIPVKDKWRTKTGISTASHVIEEIAKENPDVAELLEYRELSKIKWTYIDSLLKKIENGKIHATFHQLGTVTGRLSSANPNLQNQPASDKYDIRGAFKAREGYTFVDADYSQIELRILASMSWDTSLINAYKEGRDIHQETADKLGITRSQAKGINFWIIYGMSHYWFAETMGVTPDEAKLFIKKYFAMFPSVMQFIRDTKNDLLKNGFWETLWGRRRHFPDYKTAEFSEKNKIERQVVNARIQWTAADIMKLALNEIYKDLWHLDAKLIVTVHDEVIVEVNDWQIEEAKEIIRNAMTWIGKKSLQVPLSIDLKTSKVWKK